MLATFGAIGGIVAGVASIVGALAALYSVHLQKRRPSRKQPIVIPILLPSHDETPRVLRCMLEVRNLEPCPVEITTISIEGPPIWEVGLQDFKTWKWARGTVSWGETVDMESKCIHFRLRSTDSTAAESFISAIRISIALSLRWSDDPTNIITIPITITAPSQNTIATS